MKKLLFLLSFVMVAGMANAQAKSCSKAGKKCCAKKAAATSSMTEAGNMTNLTSDGLLTADTFAAQDENIEKRVCEKSGKACYFQKSVCTDSGKISWDEVKFCDKSQAFKQVAQATEVDNPALEMKKVAPAAGGSEF